MHDPKTVAFEIKNPFKDKDGYRPSLITVWHNDPQNFKYKDGSTKMGCGSDDSCGWSRSHFRETELEAIKQLGKKHYWQMYSRQHAIAESKSYFNVCRDPETMYEVIYWIWRAIKAHGKKGWQYGKDLNIKEINYIMNLSSNPTDNFKNHTVEKESDFIELFVLIWKCYLMFQRPWYKHPRWHIHHWNLQIHTIQQFKRKYWDKCSECGKRGFKSSPMSDWYGTKLWHQECDTTHKVPVKE